MKEKPMAETPLHRLAAFYGIVLDGEASASGDPETSEQWLVELLRAAGLPLASVSEAEGMLRETLSGADREMLVPVTVCRENDFPLRLTVRLPKNDTQRYRWTLTEETGKRHDGCFSSEELASPVSKLDAITDFLPYFFEIHEKPQCGYHRLSLHPDGKTTDESVAAMLLIVVPERCYTPPGLDGTGRVWGVSIHLHAVRSRRNWGIGDFTDLLQIFSWAAVQGAGAVHTSPLHFLDPGSSSSSNPYSSSSRSHLNTLFVNIEAIPEFADCHEVREVIHDIRYQARLASIRDQDRIDPGAICKLKEEALRILWKHFSENHLNPSTLRGEEFRRFQREGGELLRYFAAYSAIWEEFGTAEGCWGGWQSWPEPLRRPESEAVAEFLLLHAYDVEYHQYKQWLATAQLAAIGRRSMELGLKIGLFAEFPYSHADNGFEGWYYQNLLLSDARIAPQQHGRPRVEPAVGLPLTIPRRLQEQGYRSLVSGLQHTMKQAGAICIRSIDRYCRSVFQLQGDAKRRLATAQYPFSDLLGIIALESQKNRCLVVVDQVDLLPEEQQAELEDRNFFTWHNLFQTSDQEEVPLRTVWPAKSVISASAPFLAGLKGLWKGVDITLQAAEGIYRQPGERETAIMARATDRARFLLNLEHEGLLPENHGIDQASLPEIDPGLMAAAQVLLARSAAKLLLVTINDLFGSPLQPSVPAMSDQSFWHERYAECLESICDAQDVSAVFQALRRERGLGVVRPSAPAPDRRKRQGLRIPTAFYRLQLHKGFTFLQAAEIVPYLAAIGISHCYVSSFLMARPGSPHGYDIINHCNLNPEIGSREDFERLIAVLEEYGMALLLDIVPNHMGVGSDNRWWMDVLENGEASLYSGYFDINWQPLQQDMIGRVMIPVLGDHYGKVLEDGQLVLNFMERTGTFFMSYYEQNFPVDPGSYPEILQYDLDRLGELLGKQYSGFMEYQSIVRSFANLPGRDQCSNDLAKTRNREKEINKRLLARLSKKYPEIRRFIEERVILFNGEPGKPASYDLLHNLLEKQAYRLTFWRVAADEINYRRFFDINDLAGLRVEEQEVFEQTHKLVIDLITTGKVDGLRVDHPDGLYNPHQYFVRLEEAAARDYWENVPIVSEDRPVAENFALYVVAEKILADYEHLPENWPVCGTTGYEFSRSLNGLFVDPASEEAMTSLYHQFIGEQYDFDEILYASKKHIITSAMVGELNVLASLLFRLARKDRASRDFTLNLLRQGLTEIVACFPVYRTYIASEKIDRQDIDFIQRAVAEARARKPFDDGSVFDFIRDVLLLRDIGDRELLPRWLDFVMRLQQYTGPVMAKGLEDTACYIYNRLLSLNEVGGNPRGFGISLAAFHQANVARQGHWPNSMVNTSTHDSKRSEDVRARINVLTEVVPLWRERVFHWSRLNSGLKTEIGDLLAPSKNDEYAFYQNLLGCWPQTVPEEAEYKELVERMVSTTIKSCREAKCHTSWVSPNEPYEQAVKHFVEGLLFLKDSSFFQDFNKFHAMISWFGMFNSISQVFFKLIVPGVPDIYQGNEIYHYCLVDPDNRRPVDFLHRQELLCSMRERMAEQGEAKDAFQRELLADFHDGRAKMYTICRALAVRNAWPDVFARGAYVPLETTGKRGSHICAFQRSLGGRWVIAAAPRFYATLLQGKTGLPLGPDIWEDTGLKLPSEVRNVIWENVFSGEPLGSNLAGTGSDCLKAATIFSSWPVALLTGRLQGGETVVDKEVTS